MGVPLFRGRKIPLIVPRGARLTFFFLAPGVHSRVKEKLAGWLTAGSQAGVTYEFLAFHEINRRALM